MNRQQIAQQLDTIARTLSTLARQVDRLMVAIQEEPEPAESEPASDRTRRHWTEEEDLQLIELRHQGVKLDDIAQRLGRTVMAVASRSSYLAKVPRAS